MFHITNRYCWGWRETENGCCRQEITKSSRSRNKAEWHDCRQPVRAGQRTGSTHSRRRNVIHDYIDVRFVRTCQSLFIRWGWIYICKDYYSTRWNFVRNTQNDMEWMQKSQLSLQRYRQIRGQSTFNCCWTSSDRGRVRQWSYTISTAS